MTTTDDLFKRVQTLLSDQRRHNLRSGLVAEKLKVSPSTFHRLIKGQSNISSEIALRMSKTLGRTPESWLAMQDNYNLWEAKQRVNLDEF